MKRIKIFINKKIIKAIFDAIEFSKSIYQNIINFICEERIYIIIIMILIVIQQIFFRIIINV